MQQLINDQKFINVQGAQAGLTRLFADAKKTGTFYTVLKNDQPLGVLIPKDRWDSMVENMEAMSSANYKKKIAEARKSKKRYSSSQMKKMLGI
ncbi:MAG: type II toxin-antitoxin system Phd/YefM family antitoxin [Patescibacteria group bacterium]